MSNKDWIDTMARVGLSAKGVVYCIIGLLIILSLVTGNSSSAKQADKGGVFNFLQELPAGPLLLGIVITGLICYTIWRLIQAFKKDNSHETSMGKRFRYACSGLVYGALSFYGIKFFMGLQSSGGSENKETAGKVLAMDGGEWMLGVAALILAGIGIYQIYYGVSEKYKKHVSGLHVSAEANRLLLGFGKAGYMARGVVWLILSFFLAKAALHSNAQDAGSTGDVFQFVKAASYGNILLFVLAMGLFCYGVFNFIRARFESFINK